MADLSGFWSRQRARATADYDQKAMVARQIIAENFNPEDDDKIHGAINHFAHSDKALICLMGVLAQVGLHALAMEDYSNGDDDVPT